MRIPRIYIPQQLHIHAMLPLDERAFQHIAKVLRLRDGAEIILFNGDGNNYPARLISVEKKSAQVEITDCQINQSESNLAIHLGLGISKGERMDYAIQKAVELGVTEISPLFTQHCVVQLDASRSTKRLEHWQGVIISACEQSGRSCIPVIHPPREYNRWLECLTEETKLILNPLATRSLRDIEPTEEKLAVLIGPEGGLSSDEISAALEAGCHDVSLGPRILRTETAALSALTTIQTLWGDLA